MSEVHGERNVVYSDVSEVQGDGHVLYSDVSEVQGDGYVVYSEVCVRYRVREMLCTVMCV